MPSFKQLFLKFHLNKVKLNLPFAELEFDAKAPDQEAAWEMYVELITRVITQPLDLDTGDEKTALDSVYSVFPLTRTILKERGRTAHNFSKVAIVVLNDIVRPFSSKWHKIALEDGLKDPVNCDKFRRELIELQLDMRCYAALLAYIAGVEDMTVINDYQLSFLQHEPELSSQDGYSGHAQLHECNKQVLCDATDCKESVESY